MGAMRIGRILLLVRLGGNVPSGVRRWGPNSSSIVISTADTVLVRSTTTINSSSTTICLGGGSGGGGSGIRFMMMENSGPSCGRLPFSEAAIKEEKPGDLFLCHWRKRQRGG